MCRLIDFYPKLFKPPPSPQHQIIRIEEIVYFTVDNVQIESHNQDTSDVNVKCKRKPVNLSENLTDLPIEALCYLI